MPNGRTEKHSILIVDDESANREVLRRILEREGHRVTIAQSGKDALEQLFLPDSEMDLVLLDQRMPCMSGIDTLKEIRKRFSASDLPVIMVTAEDESASVINALDNGANDYITKPVNFPVLSARVRTHLAQLRAERQLRSSERRYALTVRGSDDGFWDLEIRASRLTVDERWLEMLGFSTTDCAPTLDLWTGAMHVDDKCSFLQALNAHCEKRAPKFEQECRVRHPDGSWRWVLIRGLAVWDENGTAVRIAGSQTDVTELKARDDLTGLATQLYFRERVSYAFEGFRRDPGSAVAVFYIDLDRFKTINDSLGHRAGDALLFEIGQRIRRFCRSGLDVSARLAGDEFALLVGPPNASEQVPEIAQRLLRQLSEPVFVAEHEVLPKASLGVSLLTADVSDADELIHNAEIAMGSAKAAKNGSFAVFSPTMRLEALNRLSLEEDLRGAELRGELFLEFQPQIHLDDDRVTGFEALIRWLHPRRGRLSPAEFIPLAESTGLIVPIGAWAMAQAARQMVTWRSMLPLEETLSVSVNVSPIQLASSGFCQMLRDVLDETQIPPRCLKMELTESVFLDPEMATRLEEVRSLGFPLKMDDFGTGFCSLGYFRTTRFDALKIDRSFISNIDSNKESFEIASTIISFGRTLGMKVIAEGIETSAQADTLRQMGCEYGQGFLYARPLSAAAAGSLLEKQCSSAAAEEAPLPHLSPQLTV